MFWCIRASCIIIMIKGMLKVKYNKSDARTKMKVYKSLGYYTKKKYIYIFYSTSYMKNIFPFTTFIVKLEYNYIRIFL